MNIFTVSLFGHRENVDLYRLEAKLTRLVKELIETKSYVSFLIGRNGEFDEYAASVIKRARGNNKDNNELILVIPYTLASIDFYEDYYDGIYIPDKAQGSYPKAAITLKNRWMIEQSDLVVFYVERNEGGAYSAMKYAKRLNKQIINIAKDK